MWLSATVDPSFYKRYLNAAAVVESTAGQLPAFASPAQANQDMAPLPIAATVEIGNTGGNAPVDVRSPFQGVNYLIALQGVYPSRG